MGWRDWTGVGERRWKKAPDEEVQPAKTLWDWLQLLIVPAILVAVTFAWSATQTRTDNKREDRRIGADRAAAEEARRDETLQNYLDEMSALMLREKLLISKRQSAVQAVARTVTLASLRRLDGERKGEVLRFLWEAGLIHLATVRLEDADLAGADLEEAPLGGAYLHRVVLRRANLRGASLASAFLQEADLTGADLERASLEGARLADAKLTGANLKFADLRGAQNLDLGRFITDLPQNDRKEFLESQEAFLDSLSPAELAKFNLTPENLATFRREANGG
jgi:uncharacterized protein YjbI with pentapeptide repeats